MEIQKIRLSGLGRFLALIYTLALLGCGILFCVKPVSGAVIQEAFLTDAVRLRVNDPIWAQYPELSIDDLTKIEQTIRESRQMRIAAEKYLDMLASSLGTHAAAFTPPDTGPEFQKLNAEIISTLEKCLGHSLSDTARDTLIEGLLDAEKDTTDILDALPDYFYGFGTLGFLALRVYGICTSLPALLSAVLVVLLLGLLLFFAGRQGLAGLRAIGVSGIVSGSLLGLVIPMAIRVLQFPLTSRLLGRAAVIDSSAFLLCGRCLFLAGVLLIFVRLLCMRRHSAS